MRNTGPYSLADQVNPLPADVSVTDLNADGVPAHWLHIPNAGGGRVLMFVHGGGYSLGSLRSDGELAAQIGRAAEMHVFFPEYRLAPEHLFPAAFDDVLASWQWLRGVRGVAAESVVLAGDSAGSGLTLALLQTLRDAGDSLPAGAVLISPLLDLTASGPRLSSELTRTGLHPRLDQVWRPPISATPIPRRRRLAAVRIDGRTAAPARPGRKRRVAAQRLRTPRERGR